MFHIQVKSFKINYIKHPGCLQKATFSYKGAVTMPIILAIKLYCISFKYTYILTKNTLGVKKLRQELKKGLDKKEVRPQNIQVYNIY